MEVDNEWTEWTLWPTSTPSSMRGLAALFLSFRTPSISSEELVISGEGIVLLGLWLTTSAMYPTAGFGAATLIAANAVMREKKIDDSIIGRWRDCTDRKSKRRQACYCLSNHVVTMRQANAHI